MFSAFDRSGWLFLALPSMTLHAARWKQFASGSTPPAVARAVATLAQAQKSVNGDAENAAWHGIWSQHILESLGLRPDDPVDFGHAVMRLALAPASAMRRGIRRAGAAVCAPRLRQCIRGADVRALKAALGEDVYNWACSAGPDVAMQVQGPAYADARHACAEIEACGVTIMHRAFDTAGAETARRAHLKLPPLVPAPVAPSGEGALRLALAAMSEESL